MFAMNIRKSTTGDLNHLTAIAEDVNPETIKNAIVQGRCWVFKDGDAPTGFAIIQPDFLGQPCVSFVYVDSEHRRKGIASRLVKHLEMAGGSDRLFASSPQSNAAMQGMFQKLGYEQCGSVHGIHTDDPELIFMRHIA